MTALSMLLLYSVLVGDAQPQPRAPAHLRAARSGSPISIDGRLDDQAWHAATPWDGFVQLAPTPGSQPTCRTTIRVLVDSHAIYVGIELQDADPTLIVRDRGRRDSVPYSDQVTVFINPVRDSRTAYSFTVGAGGDVADALVFGDDEEASEWDASWAGAASLTESGWTAEFSIPLAALRLPSEQGRPWGFLVKRLVARTGEELVSTPVTRSDKGLVSRYGELEGVEDLQPVPFLALSPYVAARGLQSDSLVWPSRRSSFNALGSAGIDVEYSSGSGWSFLGTMNPDFGQVEADEAVLNLSRYELEMPEKRPYFNHGLELFRGPTAPYQSSPQQLVYSRRVGLEAPIFGAGKLTGQPAETVQVGMFAAAVVGALGDGWHSEYSEDHSPRFFAAQPFTFGSMAARPELAAASRLFVSGAARAQLSPGADIGVVGTSVTSLDRPCTVGDASAAPEGANGRPARCDSLLGHALAIDWSVRSSNSEWSARGQVTGSQYLGGDVGSGRLTGSGTQSTDPVAPPKRQLADGTVLSVGDLGAGGFLTFGKMGGEPWRFDVTLEWESPRLELNALGYMRTQDESRVRPIVRFVRPSGGAGLQSYGVFVGADLRATSSEGLSTGRQLFASFDLRFTGNSGGGCEASHDSPVYDVREVARWGRPLWQSGGWSLRCWGDSPQGRLVTASVNGGLTNRSAYLGVAGAMSASFGGSLSIRWSEEFVTEVGGSFERQEYPVRWLESHEDGVAILARLRVDASSITIRQSAYLHRNVSLQLYAQLFGAAGAYGPSFSSGPGAGRIDWSDLVASPEPPTSLSDWASGRLNGSAVLRWTFGESVLHLVYSRDMERPSAEPGRLGWSRQFESVRHWAATDVALIKWAFRWTQ